MKRLGPGLAALAMLVAASAGASIVWASSEGRLELAVADPPVRFESGSGAAKERHVSELEVSENGTSFSGTIVSRAGAEVRVKDVVRLVVGDAAPRNVTIRAEPVANARVEAFSWTIRDGGATLATLDLRAAAPSVTLSPPAGRALEMDLRIRLSEGAGNHDAAAPFSLQVVIP